MTPVVDQFADRLTALGWVTGLLVGGSLATGDYIPGISDLDLVALTAAPPDPDRRSTLAALHRDIDNGPGQGLKLGCCYVDATRATDLDLRHPTWTHGSFVERALSGIARAELVRHGYAVFGPAPSDVFPPMTDDDVRAAARAELDGYWAWAARRPWMWLSPEIADLGLTSMARGRYAVANGELLTKTRAIELARAPEWLRDHLAARRRGEPVRSPRLRTAYVAWRDARSTVTR
jgi:hypothetical protein